MVYSHPNVTGDNKYLNQGKEFQIELSTYDFEARMYDPVLGRTFQMDPMADVYYNLSPYSWVANNPLKYTDPTGMLIDDYYGIVDNELVFLGSDGQGSNIRLVNEGKHEEALSNLNGENTTEAQRETLRSGDISKIVTFNEGNIQSEFQGANDRTITNGLENSVIVTLDPATAIVDAQPGAQGTNKDVENTVNTYGSGGEWTEDGSKLVLGIGHGHPKQTDGSINVPGYSKGDSETAGTSSGATYSIDSYNTKAGGGATIHQARSGGRPGRNPIGTTRNTNEIGKRSFLHTAKTNM